MTLLIKDSFHYMIDRESQIFHLALGEGRIATARSSLRDFCYVVEEHAATRSDRRYSFGLLIKMFRHARKELCESTCEFATLVRDDTAINRLRSRYRTAKALVA